ncbi:uncharacterized protein LOC110099545 [Dendrobium catenatum]|uniref:DUF6821 domain-containing protein n=1 Tax=Dendrobium catenatum TaxID=906689 RepID=A0A2I0VFG8_9ASPA|nr:uncharacterized protein LOC110099545 [Dendrobium catenatum]PKU62160.1 hypothetical protein MA16_Dca020566 [Dendrobium catenatum]
MEEGTDFHEWEMILSSNISDNLKSVEVLDEDTEDGAIKADYFSLNSGGRRRKIPSEEESVEVGNDSDNPSWVDPDSDSRLLEGSRGKLGFVGMKLPVGNSNCFWSDESSDGQRSLPDSEKMELGNLGDSVMETASEETDDMCENQGGQSQGNENSGAQEMIPVHVCADSSGGEKRENVWWKMPLELLKFCIFRVRPAWSISIAAAMVGIIMLGRKLYRLKQKSRIIPLKIAIDDKKASQFVARSARLKAISLVRYMPLMRPSLPASGATQWAALPLR